MEDALDASNPTQRPYRSHKIRACDHCRKRKQRCLVYVIGEPCQLCQQQEKQCRYTEGDDSLPTQSSSTSELRPSLKRSHSASRIGEHFQHLVPRSSIPQAVPSEEPQISDQNTDTLNQSAHIVSPIVSRDAHVLEQYMSPGSPAGPRSTNNPYSVYSADPNMPVLYTKVERRRQGLSLPQEPGIKQKEIMDQIMAAESRCLLDFYLEKIHPAFPIIDERKLVVSSAGSENQNPSATLLCELYAFVLSFWDQAECAHKRTRPDQRFAWNLAVKALQEDFMAPGISTLQAVLVDLTGRPIFSLTGNVINIGRSVALAYSLGLNRNPKHWNIPRQEMDLRIRLWWGVLIHDTWGSLAHGTPPNISTNHYDVPIPTLDGLSPLHGRQNHRQSSECFLALCRLTEILGHLLPLAYDLRGKSQRDIRKIVRSVEMDLDTWEEDLPSCLEKSSATDMLVSGSSTLHLCFLSLKMLVCRVSLQAVNISDAEETGAEALSYYQAECRKSAMAIVNFVSSLKSFHLAEFWLPYSAYYLTSAATLLLRFAVETTDNNIAASCVSSAKSFIRYLKEIQELYGWDLADHCLTQCEGIITRMLYNGRPQNADVEGGVSTSPMSAITPMPSAPFFEMDGPLDWFDMSLPPSFRITGNGQGRDVWDMFEVNNLGQ